MRLFLLCALTMTAFAANSVLNRAAIGEGHAGPVDFAAVRLVSGAIMLWLLVWWGGRRPHLTAGAFRQAGALLLYMVGFSVAYLALPAGTGALILFGGVQLTMFAGAVLSREAVPARRWQGAALAFAGLVWLLAPGAQGAVPLLAAAAMLAAAVGWGIYSLLGGGVRDPLAATAVNFALASLPVAGVSLALHIAGRGAPAPDATGILLAFLSGAVTSGLGYALWYSILPALGATRAAVAQLTVPLIAAAGGLALLSEPPTLRLVLATALVLGGVALALSRRQGG